MADLRPARSLSAATSSKKVGLNAPSPPKLTNDITRRTSGWNHSLPLDSYVVASLAEAVLHCRCENKQASNRLSAMLTVVNVDDLP